MFLAKTLKLFDLALIIYILLQIGIEEESLQYILIKLF